MSAWIKATVGDADVSDLIATWKPHAIETGHYVLDPHHDPTKNSWRIGAPVLSETMSLGDVARVIASADHYPEAL